MRSSSTRVNNTTEDEYRYTERAYNVTNISYSLLFLEIWVTLILVQERHCNLMIDFLFYLQIETITFAKNTQSTGTGASNN